MMRRLISCGTYDNGNLRFAVPPGNYSLDVYANTDRTRDTNDLQPSRPTKLRVDGTRESIDIGTIPLERARRGRTELEASARQAGRWRDYTNHVGESAPAWHSIAARGMRHDANVKDLRGKWLLIHFGGMSFVPCLANGLPRMINFDEEHAADRHRFEMVGVGIDMDKRFSNFAELNRKRVVYPQVLDDSFQSWDRNGISGLGTVVLIDPQGNPHQGDEATLARIH